MNCVTRTGFSQVQAYVYGVDSSSALEHLTFVPSSKETKPTVQDSLDESSGSSSGFPELQSRYLENYTTEIHRRLYRPVEHILLKQEMYLAGHPKYNHREAHPQKELRADVVSVASSAK